MVSSAEFVAAWLCPKFASDRGASMIEYALLLALIALICIIALQLLGEEASDRLSDVGSSLNNPN